MKWFLGYPLCFGIISEITKIIKQAIFIQICTEWESARALRLELRSKQKFGEILIF
jgi:hypothetical protein